MIAAIWTWIECHTQLVAAAIAFLAFFVAVRQFALSRKHNVRSLRPLLFHKEHKNGAPIRRSVGGMLLSTDHFAIHEYAITLHNGGLGPAIVESCVFRSAKGPFSAFNDTNIRSAFDSTFPDPAVRPKVSWTTLGAGTVIGKDTEYELLRIKVSNFRELAALDEVFRSFEFHFVLEFSTLHDEKFVYDTRGNPTRQRKRGWVSKLFGADATVA